MCLQSATKQPFYQESFTARQIRRTRKKKEQYTTAYFSQKSL